MEKNEIWKEFSMIKRKVFALITILILILAGCGKEEKGSLTIYSFSGENEQFTVSNGVVVLNGTEQIFDGGDLKVTDNLFPNITTYTTTFYMLASNEKKVILNNSVSDMTGGSLNLSCDLGKVSGKNIITSTENDNDLNNNLYFELTTIDKEGEKSVYLLQMSLSEVIAKGVN